MRGYDAVGYVVVDCLVGGLEVGNFWSGGVRWGDKMGGIEEEEEGEERERQ